MTKYLINWEGGDWAQCNGNACTMCTTRPILTVPHHRGSGSSWTSASNIFIFGYKQHRLHDTMLNWKIRGQFQNIVPLFIGIPVRVHFNHSNRFYFSDLTRRLCENYLKIQNIKFVVSSFLTLLLHMAHAPINIPVPDIAQNTRYMCVCVCLEKNWSANDYWIQCMRLSAY